MGTGLRLFYERLFDFKVIQTKPSINIKLLAVTLLKIGNAAVEMPISRARGAPRPLMRLPMGLATILFLFFQWKNTENLGFSCVIVMLIFPTRRLARNMLFIIRALKPLLRKTMAMVATKEMVETMGVKTKEMVETMGVKTKEMVATMRVVHLVVVAEAPTLLLKPLVGDLTGVPLPALLLDPLPGLG